MYMMGANGIRNHGETDAMRIKVKVHMVSCVKVMRKLSARAASITSCAEWVEFKWAVTEETNCHWQ
jgi:hypothetical protein